MIYHTLEELGNNTLHPNDTVYFCVNGKQLKYYVQYDHLSNVYKPNNAEIFSILSINKNDFCNSHYGYYNYGGDWPSSKSSDFAALTRVVIALYQEIESKKVRKTTIHSDGNHLVQKLETNLYDILSMPLSITPSILEKKEDTSSTILIKRKSKIKRIIGEEPIKLNNY